MAVVELIQQLARRPQRRQQQLIPLSESMPAASAGVTCLPFLRLRCCLPGLLPCQHPPTHLSACVSTLHCPHTTLTFTPVPLPATACSVYTPRREGAASFAELLDAVAGVDPEMRVRFTSPHPKDFSDDVLQVGGWLDGRVGG